MAWSGLVWSRKKLTTLFRPRCRLHATYQRTQHDSPHPPFSLRYFLFFSSLARSLTFHVHVCTCWRRLPLLDSFYLSRYNCLNGVKCRHGSTRVTWTARMPQLQHSCISLPIPSIYLPALVSFQLPFLNLSLFFYFYVLLVSLPNVAFSFSTVAFWLVIVECTSDGTHCVSPCRPPSMPETWAPKPHIITSPRRRRLAVTGRS